MQVKKQQLEPDWATELNWSLKNIYDIVVNRLNISVIEDTEKGIEYLS